MPLFARITCWRECSARLNSSNQPGYNPYSDKNEIQGYEQWGSAFADSQSPEETAWIKNQIDDENEDRGYCLRQG
jgi:hypothetical protein